MSGEKRTVAYGEPEQFYYAFWGCETSGWKASMEDFITVTWQGRKSEVQLKFTSLGKQEKRWETGKPWGLRFYIIGGKNLKLIFTIRLLIKPIVNPLNVTVGPNRILANTKPIPRGLALRNLCQSLFSNQCLLTSQSFPSRLCAPCRSALVKDAKNLSDFDQFPTRANHLLLAVLLCQKPFLWRCWFYV